MKVLLRIYLVLIFTGGAIDAGSVNDSVHSGFVVEAAIFAKPSYSQDLQSLADCLNSPGNDKDKTKAGINAQVEEF